MRKPTCCASRSGRPSRSGPFGHLEPIISTWTGAIHPPPSPTPMSILTFFKKPSSPVPSPKRRPLPTPPTSPKAQPPQQPMSPDTVPRTPSLTSSSGSTSSEPHLASPMTAESPRLPSPTTRSRSPLTAKPAFVSSPKSFSQPLLECTNQVELQSPVALRPPRARPPSFMMQISQERIHPVRPPSRQNTLILGLYSSYLAAICFQPKILHALLSFLDFREFQGIIDACKALKGLMGEERCKDAILSRFVPGYRYGRTRYFSRPPIRIDLSDLETLMMSQMLPVHQYPMHALNVIGGGAPSSATKQLERFAQAHSRFILLLRSRAAPASAQVELDDPFWRLDGASEFGNLRELIFPAPLAYLPPTDSTPTKPSSLESPPQSPSPASTSPPPAKKAKRSSVLAIFSPTTNENQPPLSPGSQLPQRAPSFLNRRISNKRAPVPPPLEVPHALRAYRSTRTRSRAYSRSRSRSGSLSTWTAGNSKQMLALVEEDDGDIFTPPRPYHLRSNSLPDSRTVTASNSSQSLTRLPQTRGASPIPPSNPHDLTMALVSSKAPVCRVFVPTDILSPVVVRACEEQIIAAGLWDHLQIGDAVCNLGYVPRNDSSDEFGAGGSGWLLFSGRSLTPYRAPDPPAFINVLAMPSPMYWSHLYQPFVSPKFFLKMPKATSPRQPRLSLIPLTTNVHSPASRRGVVKVKKFAWVGKIDGWEVSDSRRMTIFTGGHHATNFSLLNPHHINDDLVSQPGENLVGEGWNIEWMLETEGTPEGKKGLYDVLNPPQDNLISEWEMVRERCSPGKIWLRLVVQPPPVTSMDDIHS